MRIFLLTIFLIGGLLAELRAQDLVRFEPLEDGPTAERLKELKRLSRTGTSFDIVAYADGLLSQEDVRINDLSKIEKLYTRAYEKRDSLAAYRLAFLYSIDNNPDKDLELSLALLKRSIEWGCIPARIDLAYAHLDTGLSKYGLRPSIPEAKRYFFDAGKPELYFASIEGKFVNLDILSSYLISFPEILPGLNIRGERYDPDSCQATIMDLERMGGILGLQLSEKYQNAIRSTYLDSTFRLARNEYIRLVEFQTRLYEAEWLQPQAEEFKEAVHTAAKQIIDFDNDPQVRVYHEQISSFNDRLAADLRVTYLEYKSQTLVSLSDYQDFQRILHRSSWLKPESDEYLKELHLFISNALEEEALEIRRGYFDYLIENDSALAFNYASSIQKDLLEDYSTSLPESGDPRQTNVDFVDLLLLNPWLADNGAKALAIAEQKYLETLDFGDTLTFILYEAHLQNRKLRYDSLKLLMTDVELIPSFIEKLPFVWHYKRLGTLKNELGWDELGYFDQGYLSESFWTRFAENWADQAFKLLAGNQSLRGYLVEHSNALGEWTLPLHASALVERAREENNPKILASFLKEMASFSIDGRALLSPEDVIEFESRLFHNRDSEAPEDLNNYFNGLEERSQSYSNTILDQLAVPLFRMHLDNAKSFGQIVAFDKFRLTKRWLNNEVNNPAISDLLLELVQMKNSLGLPLAINAIELDDVRLLKSLLAEGLNEGTISEMGLSLLGTASLYSAKECAKLLRDAGGTLSPSDSVKIQNMRQARGLD